MVEETTRNKRRSLPRGGRGFKESDTNGGRRRRSSSWEEAEERISEEEIQFLRRKQVLYSHILAPFAGLYLCKMWSLH